MSNPKKAFKGGYRFKNFKGEAAPKVVEQKASHTVVIPLKQGCGDPATPIVDQGDTVKKGQIIGESTDSYGSPVHSPVTGVVSEIAAVGEKEIPAIIIDTPFGRTPPYWVN